PVVPYLNRSGYDNYRISISPNGQRLIFSSRDIESAELKERKKYPSFMYSIPLEGGDAKRLTDTWAAEQSFSPDGGKIAYASPDYWGNDGGHQSLWVVNSDGSGPVRLADTPGLVRGPVWSPDGDLIAFNHDPRNMNIGEEIWIITLSKSGKASGAPAKIKLPFESHKIISGWTADNKIGLMMMIPMHHAIYTVPATGGKATQVTPDTPNCWASYPKWSTDGRTLFFRWKGGNIASVPSEGGKLHIVLSQEKTGIGEATPGGGNGMSPDGKNIVFSAGKIGTRPIEINIWTVSVDGKDLTQVSTSPTQDRHPSWSPDGKFIAFSRYEPKANDEYEMNLFLIPSEGGEARKLTSTSNRVAYASIDWSPDGKYIAYFSREKTLNLIPVEGGEHRVLVDVENVSGHSNLSWSPDGKELAYTSLGRLLVVSVEGGEPREVETGFLKEGVWDFHIDWSPDGKKFVFSAGFGGEYELWLMEDFLHLLKRPK
ncbi:MAG: PD40 domain-containing protein, partial [Deltaproteobacteria bacterium]|nr:PD40 domain-containing protein [Deltaproteobacteria bacterium]